MNDRDKLPALPAVLSDLLVMAPLDLPDMPIFVLSWGQAERLASRLEHALDQEEKRRLKQFALPDLGLRFLVGRAVLRCLLSRFASDDIGETAWRFGKCMNGKPAIRAPKTSIASFNLSYADSFLAIAISKTLEIGIDAEVEHRIPDDEIPWHLFSTDEQKLLRTTPKTNFQSAFFRLWTLKEAIAKQTGQGFATEFSEINTLELSVAENVKEIASVKNGDNLLFHTRLMIEEKPLHLAISTASAP